MTMLRVRINEGESAQANLLWDSQWHPPYGVADFAIAGTDEPQNRGGLRAKAALHTAIVLSLFSDKRVPKDHPLFYLVEGGDPRGWWGDGVDVRQELAETDLGSLLWLFERAELTENIRRWVEAIALDALAPLISQGAAVRITAEAVSVSAINRLDLYVKVYGRDATKVYDYRFDDIWQQTATSPPPLPFPQLPLA